MTETDRNTPGDDENEIVELASPPCLLHELDGEGRMPEEPARSPSPGPTLDAKDEPQQIEPEQGAGQERQDD